MDCAEGVVLTEQAWEQSMEENVQETYFRYCRQTVQNPHDPLGWLHKGEYALRTSLLSNIRTEEAIECVRRCLTEAECRHTGVAETATWIRLAAQAMTDAILEMLDICLRFYEENRRLPQAEAILWEQLDRMLTLLQYLACLLSAMDVRNGDGKQTWALIDQCCQRISIPRLEKSWDMLRREKCEKILALKRCE